MSKSLCLSLSTKSQAYKLLQNHYVLSRKETKAINKSIQKASYKHLLSSSALKPNFHEFGSPNLQNTSKIDAKFHPNCFKNRSRIDVEGDFGSESEF